MHEKRGTLMLLIPLFEAFELPDLSKRATKTPRRMNKPAYILKMHEAE